MAAYPRESASQSVLRNVLIVVAVAITLYLLYLLRRPLGWLVIATFLAIAMSGPVNWLHRRLGRRGPAIALAYIVLLLVPVGLGAIVVPPVVTGATTWRTTRRSTPPTSRTSCRRTRRCAGSRTTTGS